MKSFFKQLHVVKPDPSSEFNSESETTIRSNRQKSPETRRQRLPKTTSATPRLSIVESHPTTKYRAVWKRALAKIKIRKALSGLNGEIILYGTSNEIVDAGSYEEIMALKRKKAMSVLQIQQKLPWYLVSPSSVFCSIWSLVVGSMLLYTITLMPYRIGFLDPVYFDAATIFDIIVDFVFICDSILNCFITYKTEGDFYETSLRKVIANYAKNWLFFDLLSCVPVSLIEVYEGQQTSARTTNSLAKIARLPRLYKILRVIRISKISSLFKQNPIYSMLTDFLDVHVIIFKFIKFFLMCILCIHNLACLWHMTAKFDNFNYDTWVMRLGFADKPNHQRYLASFYWATTTLATVGYGDICARTNLEMVFSILTMGVGVGFYSMIISSVTNLISFIDIKEAKTSAKLAQVEEFAEEVGLSQATKHRIRKIIRQNAENLTIDQQALFRHMPKSLKFEVAMSMYEGIAHMMPMLKNKDQSFVTSLISRLKPLNVSDEEVLYSVGSIAEEVYFVQKGRLELILPECEDYVYNSYLKGSYYGEIELFHNLVRVDSLRATVNSRLLILKAFDFQGLCRDFQHIMRDLELTAYERLKRNTMAKVSSYRSLQERFPGLKINLTLYQNIVDKFKAMLTNKKSYCLNQVLQKDQEMNLKAETLHQEAEELKKIVRTIFSKFPPKKVLPPILKNQGC